MRSAAPRPDLPPERNWWRRHSTLLATVALLALTTGLAAGSQAALRRADGAGVLLVVEDDGPGERRADSILLARWWRSCDALTLTSLPRDMTAGAGTEPLAVMYDTVGARRMADAVEGLLGVDVAAVVTLDLEGVERLARAIGPVTVDLPAESLDRRTGFHAGPGPVELSPQDTIAFLRSRTWEQWQDDDWTVVGSSDLLRLEQLHRYLGVAIESVSGSSERARVAVELVRNGRLDLVDPLALAGFVLGARATSDIVFGTAPVVPERTVDERRSPFAPGDLGAGFRLALDRRAVVTPDPCGSR